MGKKIFSAFSFLALAIASLYCFYVITGYAVIPSAVLTVPKNKTDNLTAPVYNEVPLNSAQQSQSTVAGTASSSGAVAATTSAKAKGKIITKTITASAANLSYNKIYVKNASSLKINLKTELLSLPNIKITQTTAPQVLIVHTHTTECYMLNERDYYTEDDKTRTTNEAQNMVAVGKVLASTLKAKGIGVVHATEKHDYPEYTGSYSRAEETINKYLKKYPTIKVVIDLHRDAVTGENGQKTALTTTINGQKAAQVMLVSGCQDGGVTGFANWRQNFRLAIRLQQTMEIMYPTLARPILLTPRKYNQHLTTGSLLIECGTEANTLKQATYSATLLGNALAATLKNIKE